MEYGPSSSSVQYGMISCYRKKFLGCMLDRVSLICPRQGFVHRLMPKRAKALLRRALFNGVKIYKTSKICFCFFLLNRWR
jgi:hypothetical protein